MKCAEITDVVIDALREGSFDHIRLNYANGDMVGHSGHLEATRVAMSSVDLQLERLEAAAREAGALLLVTADHGNADAMYQRNKDGSVAKGDDGQPLPRTSHTLSLVPFLVVDPAHRLDLRRDLSNPSIANIGATLLHLLGVPVPDGWLPSLIAPPEG